MKRNGIITILVMFMCIFVLPLSVQSGTDIERWAFGPWQTQSMISWGDEVLIVDFGKNGLWHYDGSWRRLSYWDPEDMLTWGDSNLIVNFGSHGLWKFDRSTWEKIAL